MGNVILVTGGARSGKSTFAEAMLSAKDRVLYIATAIAFDEEMKERIALHKAQRPDSWETLEAYDQLEDKILQSGEKYDGILLDCITVMLTNLMFNHEKFDENHLTKEFWMELESQVMTEMKSLVQQIREISETTIFVTNEIGSGLVPETALSRSFRDMAGRINQMMAKESDEVYLVVAGIPVKIKGREA
jgi:adenosylcobinamide kinase/adenosylcobinamide-phosphate guanylyltransferase